MYSKGEAARTHRVDDVQHAGPAGHDVALQDAGVAADALQLRGRGAGRSGLVLGVRAPRHTSLAHNSYIVQHVTRCSPLTCWLGPTLTFRKLTCNASAIHQLLGERTLHLLAAACLQPANTARVHFNSDASRLNGVGPDLINGVAAVDGRPGLQGVGGPQPAQHCGRGGAGRGSTR